MLDGGLECVYINTSKIPKGFSVPYIKNVFTLPRSSQDNEAIEVDFVPVQGMIVS